jgi:FkbM family methyltransferase
MGLLKKLNTALDILRSRGVKGVFRTIKAKMTPPQPDESLIAFKLLSSSTSRGLMIDVGAHHGGSLAPFAQSGWQIYAFEPDSKNRSILQDSFGDHPNIRIDSRALSDRVATDVSFYTSDESTGVSGLSAFLPSHQAGEQVSVTTLAKVLEEFQLLDQTVDFLKIDVEGFDLMVLRGYPWEQNRPRVILCEFEDAKTQPQGYNFETLAEFLINQGYRLVVSEWHPIKAYGEQHHWRRFVTYPCKLDDPRAWGNILAVREQGLFDQLLERCQL